MYDMTQWWYHLRCTKRTRCNHGENANKNTRKRFIPISWREKRGERRKTRSITRRVGVPIISTQPSPALKGYADACHKHIIPPPHRQRNEKRILRWKCLSWPMEATWSDRKRKNYIFSRLWKLLAPVPRETRRCSNYTRWFITLLGAPKFSYILRPTFFDKLRFIY